MYRSIDLFVQKAPYKVAFSYVKPCTWGTSSEYPPGPTAIWLLTWRSDNMDVGNTFHFYCLQADYWKRQTDNQKSCCLPPVNFYLQDFHNDVSDDQKRHSLQQLVADAQYILYVNCNGLLLYS